MTWPGAASRCGWYKSNVLTRAFSFGSMETLRLDWPAPKFRIPEKISIKGLGGSRHCQKAATATFRPFANFLSAEHQNQQIADIKAPNTAEEEKKQSVSEQPKELKRQHASDTLREELTKKAFHEIKKPKFLKTIFD